MKKIKHMTYGYDYNGLGLSAEMVKKLNEMIDAINKQHEQIEMLTKTCDELLCRITVQESNSQFAFEKIEKLEDETK